MIQVYIWKENKFIQLRCCVQSSLPISKVKGIVVVTKITLPHKHTDTHPHSFTCTHTYTQRQKTSEQKMWKYGCYFITSAGYQRIILQIALVCFWVWTAAADVATAAATGRSRHTWVLICDTCFVWSLCGRLMAWHVSGQAMVAMHSHAAHKHTHTSRRRWRLRRGVERQYVLRRTQNSGQTTVGAPVQLCTCVCVFAFLLQNSI